MKSPLQMTRGPFPNSLCSPLFHFFTVQTSNGEALLRRSSTPFIHEEKGKGIKVAEWLLENGLDYHATP